MGILTGLLGDGPPKPTTVPLDAETQKLIGDQYLRANESNGQIAGHMNEGVQAAGNQLAQSDQSLNQSAASSAQDPGQLQAIRNQYSRVASKGINDIMKQNQQQAAIKRQKMMSDTMASMMAKQRVEAQNNEMLMNAANQADMARASLLSSIFGAAGMGAGMYFGSGNGKPKQPSNFNNAGDQSDMRGMSASPDMGGQ